VRATFQKGDISLFPLFVTFLQEFHFKQKKNFSVLQFIFAAEKIYFFDHVRGGRGPRATDN
jgi:hypothetical protein